LCEVLAIPRERALAINDPVLQSLGVMGAQSGGGWRLPKLLRFAGGKDFLTTLGKAAPYAAGTLALVDALGEFREEGPIQRNASAAAGNLGITALGALLGLPFGGPAGAIGGAALGGTLANMFLGDTGADVGTGIYDAVTGYSPQEEEARKAREKILADAANNAQAYALQKKTLMPITEQELEMYRQADAARAEQELRLKNDYNYANMLNQSLLAAQQNAALQQLAMSQRA